MRHLLPFLLAFIACSPAHRPPTENDRQAIGAMLDAFNVAAGKADYDGYFAFYTDDATFLGTDATEVWDKKTFMVWSKPYFDRGRAWNFTSLERHIYFGNHPDIAWFDELLQTQMKLCRGSGVVVKRNGVWKVQQYVLSATIPNSVMDDVIKLKAAEEDSLINVIKRR
jgi:hypothetical protein